MAEAIARRDASDLGLTGIEVGSAGTAAWEGAPASDGALLVALEHHVDLSGHHARLLTRELLDKVSRARRYGREPIGGLLEERP